MHFGSASQNTAPDRAIHTALVDTTNARYVGKKNSVSSFVYTLPIPSVFRLFSYILYIFVEFLIKKIFILHNYFAKSY